MGCKISKTGNTKSFRKVQANSAGLLNGLVFTDAGCDSTPPAGHLAARRSFGEYLDESPSLATKTPLVPKQRDHVLMAKLQNFQAATFALGRPARMSIMAFVVLGFSGDCSSKVNLLDEFPFFEIQTEQTGQFQWVHEEWKELVKAVQNQLGGRELRRDKNAEMAAAIRAVPDSHARELIKDCLKVSELVNSTITNLHRVAELVADEELTDQAFVKELEWAGALHVLNKFA